MGANTERVDTGGHGSERAGVGDRVGNLTITEVLRSTGKPNF